MQLRVHGGPQTTVDDGVNLRLGSLLVAPIPISASDPRFSSCPGHPRSGQQPTGGTTCTGPASVRTDLVVVYGRETTAGHAPALPRLWFREDDTHSVRADRGRLFGNRGG